ncbi:head-tail adaptor protein [Gemmobacter aquarius]|uniref:Head-tail adaptor protein n=1 Tax=Paragemmobacter aquarius TaxID=2169400 RepID=A0A2S0UM61_9RHOB|nr:head-tail adaptor protein [Gemmobacter aquarius]AWB48886.1 head-tail adaptor protein [Gemmobacter aquarius]
MRAGKMVHPLAVLRWQPSGVDANGTQQGTWPTLATLRAELVQEGQEAGAGQTGLTQEAGLTVRVRAAVDITAADRVTFRGKTYSVDRVEVIGRRRGLELVLSDQLDGGT